MTFTKLTASTAAILLSSTALWAQDASSGMGDVQNVFVDVGGTAVQVPIDIAAQACGMDAASLQQMASTNIEGTGLDPMQVYGSMDTAAAGDTSMDATSTDAATTETADAGASTDASGAASTDAGSTDMAAADTSTDASGAASTDAAGSTDMAAADTSTDASGAASTDAASTDMAAADDTSTDATAGVSDVETTAADTTTTPDASTTDAQSTASDPLLQLAVCSVDEAQAASFNIDTSRTGSSLGIDTSGMMSGDAATTN